MTAPQTQSPKSNTKEFDVLVPLAYGWRQMVVDGVNVRVKGELAISTIEKICRDFRKPELDKSDAKRWASSLSGHFAIVVWTDELLFCCVDRIRSTPLIWTQHAQNKLVVSQCAQDLLQCMPDRDRKLNDNQALAIAMSGFTIGFETLYQDVCSLLPGQYLLAHSAVPAAQPTVGFYNRFRPWLANERGNDDTAETERELAETTLTVMEKTIRSANGRTILVPLSAGLDSRLIVSALHHLGHSNVICFAYGMKGNREAETSKAIAEKLGYPWFFTPYSNRTMARQFESEDYREYIGYADSLTAVHFPQDYPAISRLTKEGKLPGDGFVVNGQSGDFISGNHIPKGLIAPALDGHDGVSQTVRYLLAKHYTQWGFLNTDRNRNTVSGMLQNEIRILRGDDDSCVQHDRGFGLYEATEFVDRQSKYVVNGQRAYDYLGLGWGLPLWDDEYIDFWQQQPLSSKAGQNLYRQLLHNRNWGDVWRDIPVNPTRLRPAWLRPVRFILKACHLLLGRDAWHRFERRYLAYLMAPLCGYALKSWREVAMDTRLPRTAISLHIESYLAGHGVSLDGYAS